MSWIKKIIGVSELIKHQKETNKLLEKIIELEKLNINNLCVSPSDRFYAN